MQKYFLATLCAAGLSLWSLSAADPEKPEPDQRAPLPKELIDEEFAKAFDHHELAEAWDDMNEERLAESASLLLKAEKELKRKHKVINSTGLFNLTLSIAGERHNTAVLNRLTEIGKDHPELQASLAAFGKLIAPSRTTEALNVNLEATSEEDFAHLKQLLWDVGAAKIRGDKTALDAMKFRVSESERLPAALRMPLAKRIDQAAASVVANPHAEALEKLVGASRAAVNANLIAGSHKTDYYKFGKGTFHLLGVEVYETWNYKNGKAAADKMIADLKASIKKSPSKHYSMTDDFLLTIRAGNKHHLLILWYDSYFDESGWFMATHAGTASGKPVLKLYDQSGKDYYHGYQWEEPVRTSPSTGAKFRFKFGAATNGDVTGHLKKPY